LTRYIDNDTDGGGYDRRKRQISELKGVIAELEMQKAGLEIRAALLEGRTFDEVASGSSYARMVRQISELRGVIADFEKRNFRVYVTGADFIRRDRLNAELKKQNAELKKQNAEIKKQIAEIEKQTAGLEKQYAELVNKKKSSLKERLARLENYWPEAEPDGK
jgi:DNA repair exonuclease SbcCD ATPase subunit